MQQGYVVVNEVPTHIITYGGWIENFPNTDGNNILILVIPGNPGIIEYYQQFMESIYKSLNCEYPVWGISHAGHVKVPSDFKIPHLSGNEHLYSLQGQIIHKIDFIEKFIPKDVQLIVIGHSIGCYITLQFMDMLPAERLIKSIFIFPALERLAESPKGQQVTSVLTYFRPMILLFVYFLSFLSIRLQKGLLEWFFKGQKVDSFIYNASLNIFDPRCTNRWTYMAKIEMDTVKHLNKEIVKRNLSRITFYYGPEDHWCPIAYYKDIKEQFPEGHIMLCDKGYDHAFVLKYSVPVGQMVSIWIHDELQKKTK